MNVVIHQNPSTRYYELYISTGDTALYPNGEWKVRKAGQEFPPAFKLDYDLYGAIANAMLGTTHADPGYLYDTQQVRDRLLTLVEKLTNATV
jgi:hypothetical protein